jgi:manganese-dependent inorganic pyrophosphatase
MFKSPTTTKYDIEIVKKLENIAWIKDISEFAMKMFDAKSDMWDINTEDLIKYDYKEYNFNWIKAGIWNLETTNPNYSLWRKDEIIKEMKEIKKKDWLDFILLSIVDIINENIADLKRRLSRKKQIVPDLSNYFNKS